MKLQILQENLVKAITQASRFASTRSQLPILGNILLTATKTKLNVSSTNLEISVSTSIGAKIEEEGELSVPSKVIADLISNLPKDSIDLETDKEQLKIETGSFSSKVLGMNAADFPKIPNLVDKDKSISLIKNEILEALPQVIFSSSLDETRPILTGVLFVLNKDSLTLVATDGFRLSRKIIKYKSESESRVVIPKGILNELSRIGEETENIFLDIQDKEKQIVFGIGDVVLTSRILEGDYPDFEKIIPKNVNTTVRLDKEDFSRAVKLASIFAREAANVVKLKFSKESLSVLAESGSSGSQETKVDIKIDGSFTGDFETSYNYRFLEDFLHSVKGEEVKIEFTTPDKAGVFTDSSDSNYLHLIMPVKVQK